MNPSQLPPDPEFAIDMDRLEYQITELAAQIHAANYRLLCLIREFDENEGWFKWGTKTCAHWLNWRCGTSLTAAREKVRVAHALPKLEKIANAFCQGRLSYSKVRAMTRIATPENEDYLMMIANHGTASHMEKLVRKYRGVERTLEETNASYKERFLSHYTDQDGSLVIRARIPAEQGGLVLKALETALDEIDDADYRARCDAERLKNDVSAEACSDEGRVNALEDGVPRTYWSTERFNDAQNAPKTDVFPGIAAKRADALCRMAEKSLSHDQSESKTADRYQVLLHVSAETSENKTHQRCELEYGPALHPETARRIGCDCSLIGIIEDKKGNPLNIGRKTRAISPSMRRALQTRDGGCRFPGCTQTKWVDGHHIHHWAEGGETSLDNLVLLCRFHHHLVHEGGFGVRRNGCGDIEFARPDGKRLPRCGFVNPTFELDPIDAIRAEQTELDITAVSCVPYMTDSTMDYGMAVDSLLQRRMS